MLHLPKNGQMGGLLLTRLYIQTQKTIELHIIWYIPNVSFAPIILNQKGVESLNAKFHQPSTM
jgi:hypothetical protein